MTKAESDILEDHPPERIGSAQIPSTTDGLRPGMIDLVGFARSWAIYRAIPGRQRRLARFYASIAGPGDLCFDIGAHIGNHTSALARCGARVIAVEPHPFFARYLTYHSRKSDQINVVQQAVGAAPGNACFHISRLTPTVSTINARWKETVGRRNGFAGVAWTRQMIVSQTSLDAMIAEHGLPRICKIDVEGAEASVLAGLSQPLEYISFEVVPVARSIALDCIDRLANLGDYVYRARFGESLRFIDDRDWTPAEARAWVAGLPEKARSGDLHARLVADQS